MSENPIGRLLHESPSSDFLQEWRQRILNYMLFASSILGLFFILFNTRELIQRGSQGVLAIMVLFYLLLVFLTIARERVPFQIKAISLNLLLFVMAMQSYLRYGLSGDGRIWLVFFVLFSTIIYELRGSIITASVSIVTHLLFSYLINSNLISILPVSEYSTPISLWVGSGITFIIVVIILALSYAIILRDLDQNLKSVTRSSDEEQQLQHGLSEQQQELEENFQKLKKQLDHTRSAANISRQLGTILDPQALIENVIEQIQESFDLYYVGAFLVDEWNRYAILAAGTGEAGQRMLADKHKLSVGGASMVGWSTAHGQPRISQDVGQEAIRFTNPHLPLTRSELALPLVVEDQVLGALSVQSTEANAFDQDDIDILHDIADNLAINLHNARLFNQLDSNLQEIQQLNREYLGEAWREIDVEGEGLSIEVESESPLAEGESAQTLNVPLALREDQVIGNILLEATRDNWSPDELEFVEAISNQAALALESARLLEETQRRVEREQTISRMTTQFSRTLDFDTLMKMIVRELGQLPNVQEASIHIAPPETIKQEDASLPSED